MQWTTDQIMAAAPDGQVAAAGKKLADARHWRNTGQDGEALWGECQGSALYQVRVSLADLTAKCTCPSRKFPCKHAVGLLVLAAQSPVAVAEKPEWVASWLAKREESTARKTKPAAEERKPDPEAQAKRAATRHERVRAGLDALDLWMNDLIRNGIAELPSHRQVWEQQAARLVDAQAPALATRLRSLANVPGASSDWADRLLGELGLIALLTHAYRRLDELHPALQADVRTAIGWTTSEEEVLATPHVSDDWLVLGTFVDDDERVRMQRTWLQGLQSGRNALVLQFAAGGAQFTEVLIPGSVIVAELAFWPSAHPQRALIVERRAQKQTELRAYATCAEVLDAFANAIAAQPWLWRIGVALDGVVPWVDARGRWSVRDRDGAALPLASSDPWKLAALSGGAPLGITAEWDGYALTPLAAVVDGVFHRLARTQ